MKIRMPRKARKNKYNIAVLQCSIQRPHTWVCDTAMLGVYAGVCLCSVCHQFLVLRKVVNRWLGALSARKHSVAIH